MTLRLSLDALAALDAIDRHGSFAAAAKSLHRVPSALSYTVQKLELDLGLAIFDRGGRRASFTPAGRELLEDGRQLLALAGDAEFRARQVARGWEVELRMTVDTLVPAESLLERVADFDALRSGTRLRLSYEALGGTWEALLAGRCDLAIGAGGEPPALSGYSVREMHRVRFLFCVAPGHPLAAAREPLKPAQIFAHRAVAVGDTSRNSAPRSTGLLLGQETLVVPDFAAKVAAQRMGLGVGYLPEAIARDEAATGRLLIRRVAEPKQKAAQYVAWRTSNRGKALAWWVERLDVATCTRALARQRVTRVAD